MNAEEGARGCAPSTSASFPDGAAPAADPPVFSTVLVYTTSARVYVVAGTSDKSRWRILNVSRLLNADDSLDASENVGDYDEAQCARVLATIAAGNASAGGMTLVARGRALVGTLRILDAHYLLLITKRKRLGRVRGHDVFGVGATELVRIAVKDMRVDGAMPTFSTSSSPSASPAAESRAPASGDEKKLKKLLAWVDLSRGCFYSHTYGLTATLQSNVLDADAASRARRDFDSPFAWNAHVSRPLRAALGGAAAARWLVPLVHGFFERRRVSLLGKRLELVLVARRSRHFAGTRYRRRGVNARGRVANEVETEQIVDASASASASASRSSFVGATRLTRSRSAPIAVSSAVQMRGSIPVFWSQEASVVAARPEIVLSARNGERGELASARAYDATARHFDLCEARYGAPTVALSLIRSNERRRREETLRDALREALETVNEARLEAGRERVACVHWDFAKHMRRGVAGTHSRKDEKTKNDAPRPSSTSTTLGLTRLARVAAGALELVGIFAVGPRVALEAAAARHERDARGGPAARAAEAWRDAECELVTGLGDGRPGDAGASASPWEVSFAAAPSEARPTVYPYDERVRDHVGVVAQRGVLRSHCIDCLDRTNVAQFAWGLAALGAQLEALGLADDEEISLDGSFAGELLEMYRAMGDSLAMQYGGSEAHEKAKMRGGGNGGNGGGDETKHASDASGVGAFARRVRDAAASSSAKMIVSARRFYSNAYTDADKQEGIDMFLGAHPATATAFDDAAESVDSRDGVASCSGGDAATPPRPLASSLNWALLRGASSRGASRDASDDDDDDEGVGGEDARSDAKKNRSADDVWVSLDAVATCVRANPVRLDGDVALPHAHRDKSARATSESPKRENAARAATASAFAARDDDDKLFFPEEEAFFFAQKPADADADADVSAEDARTYAAFAAGAFADDFSVYPVADTGRREDEDDVFLSVGHDEDEARRGSIPEPRRDREWCESSAAAAYAAVETATRARLGVDSY
jgi:hypothetical protein